MPSHRARFVTACQQLLTLGLVCAVLVPAANVVSLDVVQRAPVTSAPTALAAYAKTTAMKSVLPAGVVDPVVTEVPLTAPSGVRGRVAAGSLQARVVPGKGRGSELTSLPQKVTGYGAVGVTWEHGKQLTEEAIQVHVRTETADAWTEWMPVQYDADHGPDPRSAEARNARPGTDALLVGDVDEVQVKVTTTDGAAPPDLRLAVIAPGEPEATTVEAPEIDTREAAPTGVAGDVTVPQAPAEGTGEAEGAIDLQAATFTPKPVIYSRAQWGADERMRDKGSLHYFEVHAGFVHHTVNANDYSQAEVPGLLRSIYAYHTRSRGWSDIGYNYLVDRFGRIWEGRAGGVDRPVVGAHTLGYNDYAFAMSAIGNFDIKQPPAAMVQAYGALFAWKLSLHGVTASSPSQRVGKKSFRAINGHRDAGSTACPGKYLYAKIPRIRELATAAQRGWTGRELESNLASTAHPDLIVRNASDKMGYVVPTGGLTTIAPAKTVLTGADGLDTVVASPDLTGDRKGDLFVRSKDGTAGVLPGNNAGAFGSLVKQTRGFAGHDAITAVGDLDRDGRNDLVARTAAGRLNAFLGAGGGSFAKRGLVGTAWGTYDKIVGAGDVNGDGHVDLLGRERGTGTMYLHAGLAGAKFKKRVVVARGWTPFDTLTGLGDYNADGRADLYVRRGDTKLGYVLPGLGNGTYGHALGPIVRTKTVGALSGAPLVAGGAPDLIARRGGAVVLFANRNTWETGAPIATGISLANADTVLNAGDWNRDGHGDMVTRNKKNGNLYLRLGDGKGRFGALRLLAKGFKKVQLLAAVGDMTGDGWPDLMGQPAGGSMMIYPGLGTGGLAAGYVAAGRVAASRQIPVGRWDADGAPDSLFRNGTRLLVRPGNGPGGLTGSKTLSVDLAPYDWVVGISDIGLTGHSDLILRERATGYLYLLPLTAAGVGARRFLAEGMGGYDLAG
ncbi:FG-GAP-like repeat-containing protein [Nocardioides sp. cx-169]|uniref:FG-GAP-like repeat-containing protein n=1 Tax=Nocardioides sp. cx-169 TaxID=2899080 RepID=UPI001E4CAEB2|nr:FG-GAP-like repeat-containing protein [Nocardioides sp. cx-169]MCD4534129.1 FG-GAP-like repeat-containing protein [Nocardioides sp. cx-169]